MGSEKEGLDIQSGLNFQIDLNDEALTTVYYRDTAGREEKGSMLTIIVGEARSELSQIVIEGCEKDALDLIHRLENTFKFLRKKIEENILDNTQQNKQK